MGGAKRRAAAVWTLTALSGLAVQSSPVRAGDEPVGPCSPYRAADGDVPSEMPGCARRRRPAPGSLADEMEFRRARDGAAVEDGAPLDAEAPPRRRARHSR